MRIQVQCEKALRISLNVPAMVIGPEFQSLLVLIPLGDSQNIPQCPSHSKRTTIPVLICPNWPIPLGDSENIP